jgi:alpha-L-rhamnosidase
LKLSDEIKKAFNDKFLDRGANQYATGSQTANAMALHLGLVPPERKEAVLKNLVDEIMIKNEGHLSTGILGTDALEQVLGENGRADVMYEIAAKTTYPGWGYTISQGATTLWETFEDDDHSLNMKMFGSIEKFFYKDLAGIGPAEPGFRKLNIKPCLVKDLTYARGSLNTLRGHVYSYWKKTENSVILKVTIPVNSEAKVHVPAIGLENLTITEGGNTVWKAGKFIEGVSGISAGGKTDDYVTFDVGSGSYVFQLKGLKSRDNKTC